jgi:imidazole glycerol-phosphate synthase subunit HisH
MSDGEIVVVDYDIGNVFSVCHAIRHAGGVPILTGDHDKIANAERLILPGVGAFGKAVDELHRRQLVDPILTFVATGRPFLGLCVGMQMLMDRSTEFGDHAGFGLVRGTVDKIATGTHEGRALKVPHIGWTELLTPAGASDDRWADGLLADLTPGRSAFYFVHSFAAYPSNPSDVLAEVAYGDTRIVAAIEHGNILGVQFHPERSGIAGQKVLRRYLAM